MDVYSIELNESLILSMTYNNTGKQYAVKESSHLWIALAVGYSLVFLIGVTGNIVLLAALCGIGKRARTLPVRNHLMVNLAAADLLVTGICVPISACAVASHACWPWYLVSWMCRLGPILQRTPVAASTLSLALLSLDRWANIRHPRIAHKIRHRKFVVLSMMIIWLLASLIAAPGFWARKWEGREDLLVLWSEMYTFDTNFGPMEQIENSTEIYPWNREGICLEHWTSIGLRLAYVATYVGTAFVSPALIVASTHASVSKKLTAQLQVLSSGEKGVLRPRPKQIILVAQDHKTNNHNGGMVENPKTSRKLIPYISNSDDDDVYLQMQIQVDLESFRQLSKMQQENNQAGNKSPRGVKSMYKTKLDKNESEKTLKASRNESSIIKANRKLRDNVSAVSSATAMARQSSSLMPVHSSQSFRSRRRAANLLAALAAVFVLCWLPYVVCSVWEMFASENSIVRLLMPFALFLGHAHSAINPVVSWRLNRSAFVRFKRQPISSFIANSSCLRAFKSCFCDLSTCCYFQFRRQRRLRRTNTCHPRFQQNQRNAINAPQSNYPDRRSQPQRAGTSAAANGGAKECIPSICFHCCFSPFNESRRESSPDIWYRNTSTNEAALGAFHPKYLNRLPTPDPVSRCHTSHFLK